MSLGKCRECGHVVSDKASVCPECGAPVVPEDFIDEDAPEAAAEKPAEQKEENVEFSSTGAAEPANGPENVVEFDAVTGGAGAAAADGGEKKKMSKKKKIIIAVVLVIALLGIINACQNQQYEQEVSNYQKAVSDYYSDAWDCGDSIDKLADKYNDAWADGRLESYEKSSDCSRRDSKMAELYNSAEESYDKIPDAPEGMEDVDNAVEKTNKTLTVYYDQVSHWAPMSYDTWSDRVSEKNSKFYTAIKELENSMK